MLVGLALAGCQQSGVPSSASPARLAPRSSLIYLELTLRPQGAQRAAIESSLTRLIGHPLAPVIHSLLGSLLSNLHLSYSRDIEPWLGQRVGIVVTSFSPFNAGLIAPTDKPAAALRAVRKFALADGHHYNGGVSNSIVLRTVGDNLVVATPSAFRQIVDASRGRSLATVPAFTTDMAALPSSALVRGYIDAGRVSSALRQKVGSLPGTTSTATRVRQALDAILAKLHGTDSFSLSAAPRALMLDIHSSSVHGQAADVSGAPGQSWLAVASNFNPARIAPLLGSLRDTPGFAQLLAKVRASLGVDLLRDVLPALGPFELSIQGTSPLTLGAGLVISPHDTSAAGRVLAAIRRLAARSPSLSVQGSDRSFTITKAGLPIPRIQVAETGGRVVATVDESFSSLLSPATHLAANPRFTSALAALPAGSRVSAFVDFRTLAQLVTGLRGFIGSSSAGPILNFVQRFNYLAVGSDQATGNTRLVLALN